MFNFDMTSIIASIPAIIIAMAIHEYAHARVAVWCGDDTPIYTGRLTLNPFSHIDIFGFLMLFIAHFGWAKPVMVNPNNFKNPKRDDILVSLAGAGANFLVGFIAMAAFPILNAMGFEMSTGLRQVLYLIVLYNVNFAIFNLLPIPPLDGSRILLAFLSPQWQYRFMRIERYSFILLIVLIYTPILRMVLVPLQQLVLGLYGVILSVF